MNFQIIDITPESATGHVSNGRSRRPFFGVHDHRDRVSDGAVVDRPIPAAQASHTRKDAIYECGEPTIGTSYVQFDLRFYVVALLFIIFDVEVAFFFPWAMVFGGATQLADNRLEPETRIVVSQKLLNHPRNPEATGDAIPSGIANAKQIKAGEAVPMGAYQLALTALVDILVFFGVLLVGFAYVWKRGDLDWVRAMTQRVKEGSQQARAPTAPPPAREPVGV